MKIMDKIRQIICAHEWTYLGEKLVHKNGYIYRAWRCVKCGKVKDEKTKRKFR